MPVAKLNSKQETFAKEVVTNGGDKIAAFKASGWSWENYAPNALGVQADKAYHHPKISLRIHELQITAASIADKAFTISVKQRLEWLKEITDAGLGTYLDAQGNARRESLTAARGAIETMNTMLGTNEQADSVKPVKVFVGVKDAS